MKSANYNNQIFKQFEDAMNKYNNLSQEIKDIKKECNREIIELKEKHTVEINKLNSKINVLEEENNNLKKENKKLRDDNDRLKKQLNNNSNNSSKPPSTDIKKNIPNNREKTGKKVGGQKGHTAHFLSKKDIEKKIKNHEIKHEIINVGNIGKEYIKKYILDIDINVVAKEYRFYKNEEGKYNIPKEFQTDVQYGNELKTMCSILNTEGIVAVGRLTDFVSAISHGKIRLSKGTIVNFLNDLSNKSEYVIEQIKNKILNAEIVYTDATTSRCNNRNICVRNYSTNKYTLLIQTKGKGKKYIEESNILNRYTGDLVHDHETVIYNYGNRHVECNVHVLRYLKGCYENTQNRWAIKMRSFLSSLNKYKKELKEKRHRKNRG